MDSRQGLFHGDEHHGTEAPVPMVEPHPLPLVSLLSPQLCSGRNIIADFN